MKEIKIISTLYIRDDLDEQDILDQFAANVKKDMGRSNCGVCEFIDAELQDTESAGRITGINITDIIDELINRNDERANDPEEKFYKQHYQGAVGGLNALKKLLEERNLAALAPAAELDQLRGENLILAMRLDKAEKLLAKAQSFIRSEFIDFVDVHGCDPKNEAYLEIIGRIALFLNTDDSFSEYEETAEWKCRICGCTDFTPCFTADGTCSWTEKDLCSACNTPDINAAKVTYDRKAEVELAKKAWAECCKEDEFKTPLMS